MAIPPEPLMRRVVLYVDSLKIGGAERVTLTFARWLRQNGWTPIVLTRQSRDLDFYPIPAGVERRWNRSRWLRLLGRWGFPWRVRRLRQAAPAAGESGHRHDHQARREAAVGSPSPADSLCGVGEEFSAVEAHGTPLGCLAAVQLLLGFVAHRADPGDRCVAETAVVGGAAVAVAQSRSVAAAPV